MKIDRLIGILSVLLQQEKVTAPYLAEKFEVSRRTVTRDLEALEKAGIPIVTVQGKNGGISIMEGYRLDRTLLTSVDMQAIAAGLKSLDSISETNRYRQLMEKLCIGGGDRAGNARPQKNGAGAGDPSDGGRGNPGGDEPFSIDLSSWYKPSLASKIEILQEAIGKRERVQFDYYAPKGESVRRVEPYRLLFRWTSWYVWGYCMERGDFRLFKLNRLWNLKTAGELFVPRENAEWDWDMQEVFPNTIEVLARFSPEAKWRLIEEYGPESFLVQSDKTLLFQWRFADRESLFGWILSFGVQAELLKPEGLRKELGEELEKMAGYYRHSG